MRALEAMPGLRVVATPAGLDGASWGERSIVLRFAPDALFVIDAAEGALADGLPDEHAIVEPETGFVGAWLTLDELRELVEEHVDWSPPVARPVLAQGLIAGVPAKLWLEDDRALLLCAAAYAHELAERLG